MSGVRVPLCPPLTHFKASHSIQPNILHAEAYRLSGTDDLPWIWWLGIDNPERARYQADHLEPQVHMHHACTRPPKDVLKTQSRASCPPSAHDLAGSLLRKRALCSLTLQGSIQERAANAMQ